MYLNRRKPMKTPLRLSASRETLAATALYNARWFAGLVVGTAATITVQAQTTVNWNGSTDTNWNNTANWDGGVVPTKVPGNQHANISGPAATPPAFWPTIVADIPAPVDIFIGLGAGNTGILNQTAGNASTGDGNWIYVGRETATGEFNLSGGSMTASGRMYVGGYSSGGGGGTGTVNVSGTGSLTTGDHLIIGEWGGIGTFNQTEGTVSVGNEVWVGQAPGGQGELNIDAGSFSNNSWVAIGRRDNEADANSAVGVVNMSGGTWTKTGGGNFIIGASGTGTFNHTGGLVDVQGGITWIGERWGSVGTLTISGGAEFRSGTFSLGLAGDSSGELNLEGGTVRTQQITGGPGPDTVVFDGTQIVVTANQANFITNLNTATIEAGGLKVDTNGFNVGVPQILSGPGGIVKSGAGTLTLSAVNAFEGDVAVNGGGLATIAQFALEEGQYPVGGNLSFADDTSMAVTVEFFGDKLPVENLTFGGGGATSLTFNFSEQPGNPFSGDEALEVEGTLTLNGTTTVHLTNSLPTVGQFPLLTYGTKAGAGSMVLGNLPDGVVATLVHDEPNKRYYLDITQVALPRWDATVNNIWDTETANWRDIVTNGALVFNNGNPVVFNDEVNAEETAPVALPGTVLPSMVTFNNEFIDYQLTGDGKISGTTGLTKQGAGSLTVGTTNDYTGVTTIQGGTVTVNQLTNGGVAGPLGAATSAAGNLVLSGGTLEYTGPATTTDRGFTITGPGGIRHENNLTFTSQILSSGGGNLVKSGAGEMKFTHLGNNVFGTAGAFLVKGGKVIFDGTGGGQTNVVGTEMWVADTPDVPADLILTNTSLSMSSWLAISRGNGNDGVCNMTVTDSTLQTGNFSTGFNNGLADNASETFVTLNNATWTNGGNTFISESPGSTATITVGGATSWTATANVFQMAIGANTTANLTVGGTSTLTVNRFQTSLGDGSLSEVIIEDSGSINKSGNSWMSIGNGGTGVGVMTVRDNGSLINSAGDFNISDVGTSTGTLNIEDSASVSSGGTVFVGKGNSDGTSAATGTINQSGGTFNAAGWVSIARYGSGTVGEVNVSGGAFNQNGTTQRVIVGEQGIATLEVSGTGVVTVNGLGVSVGQGADANGTVNLNTGGVLVAREVVELANGGASQVNFNGGTLRALAGSGNFLAVDTATIGAGGATIDTNGNAVTVAQALQGAGGLTKTGAGTLTLSGALTYAGNTTVSAGTLSMAAPSLPNGANVTVANGAIIDLPHGQEDFVAGLTLGVEVLGEGTYDATTHPAFITGSGSITVGTAPGTAYDTWAAANGLTAGVNDDPDLDVEFDGIPNLLEYILGGDPLANDPGILPDPEVTDTHFVFTFERSDDSETDTTLAFQWGTNLQTWNTVTVGAASSGPDGAGVTVEVSEGTPASAPDTVVIRVPKANAGGGKLFGRLNATKP